MGIDMVKKRLDVLLVEYGLAESPVQAQRLVMAGQVRVAGQVALKPTVQVAEGAEVTVEQGPRFVSRGGEKLEAALLAFNVPLSGRICADVGASTGGFTDCLLQHGAAKVYTIDVGQGILGWKLRQNPRVVVMESTNARYVERLPEPVSLVTVDASFISLKILLPVLARWFAPAASSKATSPPPPAGGGGPGGRGPRPDQAPVRGQPGRGQARQGRHPRCGRPPPGAGGGAGLRPGAGLWDWRAAALAPARPQGQHRVPGPPALAR